MKGYERKKNGNVEESETTCCISTNEALAIEASPLSIIRCSKTPICLFFSMISRSKFWICGWQNYTLVFIRALEKIMDTQLYITAPFYMLDN
jgi:hypothetical protein